MARFLKNMREYLTPVRTESAFLDKGVLTPEEFVAAGDLLVYKCPTWAWEAGEPSKMKSYLPPNKQYLVTKDVPCYRRVSSLEKEEVQETKINMNDNEDKEGENDVWIATEVSESLGGNKQDEIETIGNSKFLISPQENVDDGQKQSNSDSESEEITNISKNLLSQSIVDDHFSSTLKKSDSNSDEVKVQQQEEAFDDGVVQLNDEATFSQPIIRAEQPDDDIMLLRRYHLSITYDKYYQTPRMWLIGFDENQQLLQPELILEDVIQDYANKTVTLETHPHLNEIHASIHPCRHASAMKKILQQLTSGGKEIRVDQYLFIFLKFIQMMVPTIEYDFTWEVEART